MSRSRPRNILFVTWDGPETPYLERLFLPIFQGLQAHGFRFHVLQFTWGDPARSESRNAVCRKAGIAYRPVLVNRRFGGAGPLLSAFMGARAIRKAVRDWQIDTLMPRSLMPALAVLRLPHSLCDRLNIIFDADGLAADERVDFAGLSSQSVTYRLLRDIETLMLCRSDVVLTRTREAARILGARAGAGMRKEIIHIVPNGVDPAPFVRALTARAIRSSPSPILCYCGSIGVQYRLPDMFKTAERLREAIPNLRFLLLSPATDQIAQALAAAGLQEADWVEYRHADPKDVPELLAGCDIGIALREPRFSTRAVLPIKLGEYLLAGLPVLGTPGVGDTGELMSEGVFRSAEAADLDATIQWLQDEALPGRETLRQRCHQAGVRHFSVAQTVERYAQALEACTSPQGVDEPRCC